MSHSPLTNGVQQPVAPPNAPQVPWYHTKPFVVFMLLFFFPVGLVLLWSSPVTKTSGRVTWSVIIGLMVLVAITSPDEPTDSAPQSVDAPTTGSTADVTNPTPVQAASPSARKPEPRPEPRPQSVQRKPVWNTVDINAETNGNLLVAAEVLRDQSPAEVMQAADSTVLPATAFKSPWKFYGKPLAFTGVVGIAQAYPPGSDISQIFGGGEVAELVLVATDGSTIIDFLLLGDSGDLNVGDMVTVYGYVVGQVEVQNKMGGQTTQLMMVGNAAE